MALFSFLVFSCAKEVGEGGNSTIYGNIVAYNYNAEFTNLRGIYPAADEYLYLIYGEDRSYSQRIRSNYNGIYEFNYLQPGNYTISAYPKDSTLIFVSEVYSVIRKVKIEDKADSNPVPYSFAGSIF